MKLTLIRGLPGSGKSTHAQHLINLTDVAKCQRPLHIEADDYFTAGGRYFFDGEWLKQAHQRCHRLTQAALLEGYDVVVANTFSRTWEMNGYLTMAELPLVDVEVLCMTKQYGSIHEVPQVVIQKMEARWEAYEGEVFVK